MQSCCFERVAASDRRKRLSGARQDLFVAVGDDEDYRKMRDRFVTEEAT